MQFDECPHKNTAVASRIIRDGSVQYRRQCQDCGAGIGQFIKRELALMERVVTWNDTLEERWYAGQRERQQQAAEAERDERRSRYHEYLDSREWAVKRRKVLERDKWLCQGCLSSRATQVHHLTYAHVFDELFYELVSLCDDCHDKAHGATGESDE